MQPTSQQLTKATHTMATGGVIAYPTEAVWGLGCDPWNEHAVKKVLQLKQRPVHKGLILVASNWNQFEPLLEGLSEIQLNQLKLTWPGPNTWLIPDPSGWAPFWIKGQHKSVALRVSSHPLVKALCDHYGKAIVSTSANLAGEDPAKTQTQIETVFGDQIDYVVAGDLGQNKQPSQVRDLVSGQVIRPA